MKNFELCAILAATTSVVAIATPAQAQQATFNIPAGSLRSALDAFGRQSGRPIVYKADEVRGIHSSGYRGKAEPEIALEAILSKTGFASQEGAGGSVAIVRSQQTAADTASEPDTEIVVTGSRIPRSSKSIPGSVTVLDRTRIEQSGSETVRDALSLSSQTMAPGPLGGFLGTAPVQLRGLSAGTTLVLIDGRRVTPSGASGAAFDVGTIPLSSVERIEILADGASAIYGADAVGGIVNILLKRSNRGLVLDGRLGVAEGAVGKERRLSATYGFATGGLRGSISADYSNTSGIKFHDRALTRNQDYRQFGGQDFRLPYQNQGTVYSTNGSNLPGLTSNRAIIPITSNGRPAASDFQATAGQENRGSDYFQNRDLLAPVERFGAVADLSYDAGGNAEIFTNIMWSRQNASYVAVYPFQTSDIVVPASNPHNPFGVNVGVNRLLTGFGPDINYARDTFYRAVGGVRGRIGDGLRWEIAANYSRDDNDVREVNTYDPSRIAASLNSSDPAKSINPFASGPVGSPELLRSLFATTNKRYIGSALSFDSQLNGSLFELPGGAASFAVGAEYRREKLDVTSSYDNNHGARDIASAYIELRAPVLPHLTLSGAGRFDHYSDFGGTFNPKLGFEWVPFNALVFSATWGTSFRAPPLSYTNSVPFTVPVTTLDPRRGNESIVVSALLGGNPNLHPETADSYTLGVRLIPLNTAGQRVDVALSAWWVSQDSRLVSPSYQTLVDNERIFSDRIVRDSPTAQDIARGYPGALVSIDSSYINFGKSKVNGIDAQVAYRGESRQAKWSLNGTATRVLNYTAQLVPNVTQERLGVYSNDGYAPKWRGSVSGSLEIDGVIGAATVRYIGSYEDRRAQVYKLGSRAFLDLQLSYQSPMEIGPLSGLRLTLGARNILGTTPPFFNQSVGFDPTNYDLKGRVVYVAIRKSV